MIKKSIFCHPLQIKNKPFVLLSDSSIQRKRKARFDIGQYQKKLKQMKQHKLEALVTEKILKENEKVELKKKSVTFQQDRLQKEGRKVVR